MAVRTSIGRFLLGTILGLAVLPAHAQSVPAEFPPESFTGNQYVDSAGCAFIRAGISGATTWVPRVNRSRDQLCNFQPTFPDQVTQAALPPLNEDLIIRITPPSRPVPAQATQPAPTRAPERVATPARVQAPAPAPTARGGDLGPPIRTIASIPANGPGPLPPILVPPPTSPRVVTAPAPVVAPEPEPQARQTPRVTLAEACDGRFGIQPGFVSSRTGQPIDCGPAPAPRGAAVTARTIATASVDTVPRMTLAQICAETAATGQRFVNARTGERINCAPAAPVAIAAAPVVPDVVAATVPRPVVAPAVPTAVASVASRCENIPNLRGDGRYAVRCGPQSQRPYTEVTPPRGNERVSTSSVPLLGNRQPVPASNPPIPRRAAVPNPPAGYERVWDDGRVNPQRGLRVVQQPAVTGERISTRTTPPQTTPLPQTTPPQSVPASNGHRYVQVGSFGDPANAQRLIQRLGAMGLPVASGRSGGLKIVAAGPFNDAGRLSQALQAVRGLGFTDAYTRR